METPAVPGSADQVDVNYTVEEKPFGNFVAGLGFSQTQGLIFQTSITQDNFLGSGKRIQFAFNNSDVNRRFALGYVNPYYTVDGISRGFSVNYQETEAFDANVTAFDSRVIGANISFGIPISEYNSINTALGYENTRLSEDGFFAQEVQDFIDDKGNEFNIIRLTAAYSHDTRNKTILPEKGMLHQVSAEIALPSFGDTVEFYKFNYRTQYFRPLIADFIFALKGEFGYGDGFGGDENLPFFENFYAGGPRSVRGYEENTLGPRDSRRRPLGGNIKLVGGAEIIIPVPFLKKFADSVRLASFFDAGNVYGSNEDFDIGDLRYSAGVGAIWVSPFGLVSVSIAQPIGDQPGDETQVFQFNFGTNF